MARGAHADVGTAASSVDERSRRLVLRLRRAEGQLRGLQRAILAGKGCEDLLAQYLAVRAALERVGLLLVERQIELCLQGPELDREKLSRLLRLCLRVRPAVQPPLEGK
jgi:DNA-binding FrmR family transcriptional regulator